VAITKLHHGTVSGGKFLPDNPETFKRVFYKYEGKRIIVKISRFKKSRSNNQNKYMWGAVYDIISDHTGYTTEEVHDAMKLLFLRVHRDGLPDTVKSTSNLNTAEMEDYLENIRRWASVEMGLYIPLPREVEY